jgi:hypothetical protein
MNSSYLIAYDNTGSATFSIDASTGAVAMKGTLTSGSSITGASIIGGTFQTSTSGQRLEMGTTLSGAGRINFHTGDATVTTPGYVMTSFASGTWATEISSPQNPNGGLFSQIRMTAHNTSPTLILRSGNGAGTVQVEASMNLNGFNLRGANNFKNGTNTVTGFSATAGQAGPQTKVITFGTAFSVTPSVSVTLSGVTSPHNWSAPTVTSVSTTGFTVNVTRLAGTTASVDFNWIAIDA